MTNTYTPPKVWEWKPGNGGKFANINRPVAGATFEQKLPRGEAKLQLYSLGTPNGIKVTILLEELLELKCRAEYDLFKIDISKGDQFGSDFVAINPNSKIPALVDYGCNPPQRVFESGAILLFLARKFGRFIPMNLTGHTECMSWLFWQMASAPYVGGGFGHFYAYAPEKFEYPINRFTMETKRQLSVLDQHLATRTYMANESYTIADMAIWPWYGRLVLGELYNAAEFLNVQEYTHLLRWAEFIAERPAVQKALAKTYQPIGE